MTREALRPKRRSPIVVRGSDGSFELKVEEWIQALFEWIGITDPLAMSVAVGVMVGLAIAVVLTSALRLVLFVLSLVFRGSLAP
jgi:hypothetical protein